MSPVIPRRTPLAEERSASLWSALAFFFVMAAYYIIRPVRDQLSGAVGSSMLPWFYGGTFVATLLLTPVFGALVARFRRRRILGWSYSFFIVNLCLFVPAFLAQEQIGARALGLVFFIWVSVFNLFVVSLFWSFMADIFESAAARRVFPLIVLGGTAGAIVGPLVPSLLAQKIGVPPILLISAIMLVAALILLLRLSVQHDRQHADSDGEVPIGGSLWAGIWELWSRPFLRYMAILMLFSDGVGTLAYTLLADYVKAHFTDSATRTAFYGNVDLATNLLVAVLQLTLTRWLLMRHGAGRVLVLVAIVNTLLLLVLFGAAQMKMLGTGISLLAIMLVLFRGFAYGMAKPASDALYTRVPRETRYKGKNFVETAVWRFGDVMVTTTVSGLGQFGVGVAGMAAIGAGIAGASTWVARKAGSSPDLLPEPPPAQAGELV
jgi:ATP:ADP antiporter, AAA family